MIDLQKKISTAHHGEIEKGQTPMSNQHRESLLSFHSIVTVFVTLVLSTSMLMLTGCGSSPENKTDTSEQTSKQDGNTSSSDKKSEDPADGSSKAEHVATPSTATGFVDIWYPTYMKTMFGLEQNQEDIRDYEHIYETNCFVELIDDEMGKSASVSIPYGSFVTTWSQKDDDYGTIMFITGEPDENDQVDAYPFEMILSSDRQTLTIQYVLEDTETKERQEFKIICERNPDTSYDRNQDLVTYIKQNDDLYENMTLDTTLPNDVLYEDDVIRLTLCGTTHEDTTNTMGYWIEAYNKLDEKNLLAMSEMAPYYKVHGITTVATYPRVIPPTETRHIYLAFDKDEINNDLSDVHGKMIFFGYDGRYVTEAEISI